MKNKALKLSAFLGVIVVLCIAGTKISRLTRTTTIQGNSLFLVVTGSTITGTTQTRAIEASNMVSELSALPTWPILGGFDDIFTNGVAVSSSATRLNIVEGSNTVVRATNAAGVVSVQINANAGGGSANISTNANQFGASTTVTIKDVPFLTNAYSFKSMMVTNPELGGSTSYSILTESGAYGSSVSGTWNVGLDASTPSLRFSSTGNKIAPVSGNTPYPSLGTTTEPFDGIHSTNLSSKKSIALGGLTASRVAFVNSGGVLTNVTSGDPANEYVHADGTTGTPAGGAGEANVNGESAVTNATKIGLVYGKAGITNLLRSLQAGNGIVQTNQGTNIVTAIDPAVVASQANLTAASNTLVSTIVANDTTTSNGVVSLISPGTFVAIANGGSGWGLIGGTQYGWTTNLSGNMQIVFTNLQTDRIYYVDVHSLGYSTTISNAAAIYFRNEGQGGVTSLSTNGTTTLIVWKDGVSGRTNAVHIGPQFSLNFAGGAPTNLLSRTITDNGWFTFGTNGTLVGSGTNVNFTAGVTGYVSGSTLHLGVTASGTASTNFAGIVVTNASEFTVHNLGSATNATISWSATNHVQWSPSNNAALALTGTPGSGTNDQRIELTLVLTNGQTSIVLPLAGRNGVPVSLLSAPSTNTLTIVYDGFRQYIEPGQSLHNANQFATDGATLNIKSGARQTNGLFYHTGDGNGLRVTNASTAAYSGFTDNGIFGDNAGLWQAGNWNGPILDFTTSTLAITPNGTPRSSLGSSSAPFNGIHATNFTAKTAFTGPIASITSTGFFGQVVVPNVATNQLLMSGGGSNIIAATVGSGLSFSGGTLSASGGTGVPAISFTPNWGALFASQGGTTNWIPGGDAGGWIVQEEFLGRADVYAQGAATVIGSYNWENNSAGTLPSTSALLNRPSGLFGSEWGIIGLRATQATSGLKFRLGQANAETMFTATNQEIFFYSTVYFGQTNNSSDKSVLRVGFSDSYAGATDEHYGANCIWLEQNTNSTNTVFIRTARANTFTVADTGYPYSVNTRLLVGAYINRYWTNVVFYAGTNLTSLSAIYTNDANIPGGIAMQPMIHHARVLTSAGNVLHTNWVGNFYVWRRTYD